MIRLSMNYTELLQKHFGFSGFRPGQEDVMLALDASKAALAVFPTGGGKSLCYQLPALVYDSVTIVVSPLIALMKDQIDFLTAHGVDAARLDSSLSLPETQAINDRLLNGKLKLLYVAPERFNNERFLTLLRRVPIALFAVDEAHCISEWGHNFRPDYLKLAETARSLGVERVLALTATATPTVVDDICAAFEIPKEGAIVTGFYRPNLNIVVTPVSDAVGQAGTLWARDEALVERLRSRTPGPTIVYVTLQKTAERVADLLSNAGLPARPYHAGMDSEKRSAVQDWWMRSAEGIVVATIAFGMGIDKSDVRYVYHYNLPKSLESYSQEIGRAGRDGQPSTVELLACFDDVPVLQNFAYGDTPAPEAVKNFLRDILRSPAEFDLSLYEASSKYDIRQLVLRTALTYLELQGVIKQGTPFYAGYEVRLHIPLDEVVSKFQGEHAQFVHDVFKAAKFGKIWYAVNPDQVAEKLGKERRRVVRCLEYLEEHRWAELRVADARMTFARGTVDDPKALLADMNARFLKREQNEVARIEQVLALVTGNTCITNALARHFGEERERPCGHCSFCETGQPAKLPPAKTIDSIPPSFPVSTWTALRANHPDALGEPRQAARFLCGLSSPGIAKARLGRHDLFGSLEEIPFQTVLEFCSSN